MGMFGTEWAAWDAPKPGQPAAKPATPPPSPAGPPVQPSRPLHRMRGMPAWHPPPPPPEPPPPPKPPEPPLLAQQSALTVDDAWGIFGIAKKRGTKTEVKKRYLDYVAANHPDKAPESEREARTTRLMQANLAFKLLERHCKW